MKRNPEAKVTHYGQCLKLRAGSLVSSFRAFVMQCNCDTLLSIPTVPPPRFSSICVRQPSHYATKGGGEQFPWGTDRVQTGQLPMAASLANCMQLFCKLKDGGTEQVSTHNRSLYSHMYLRPATASEPSIGGTTLLYSTLSMVYKQHRGI